MILSLFPKEAGESNVLLTKIFSIAFHNLTFIPFNNETEENIAVLNYLLPAQI